MKARKAAYARGFTLTEMMVAMAITLLLVLGLSTVMSGSMKAWSRQNGKNTRFSDARYFLQRFSDEVQGAVVDEDMGLGFQSLSTTGVAFLAPYRNESSGDICYFNYVFDSVSRSIFKGFVGSEATYNADYNPTIDFGEVALENVTDFRIECFEDNGLASSEPTPVVPWPSNGTRPSMIRITLTVIDATAGIQIDATHGAAQDELINRRSTTLRKEINL